MVHGFIITHGDLGAELLKTAELIVGPISGCESESNRTMSDDELCGLLNGFLEEHRSEACVVFVDFFGGSCASLGIRVLRDHPNAFLIGGINLPMLLTFLNKRDQLGPEALVDHILARGRSSIDACDTAAFQKENG